jgi:hypothetical protein
MHRQKIPLPSWQGTLDIGSVNWIGARDTAEQTGIWIAHRLGQFDQVYRFQCGIDQAQIA